MCGDKVNLQSSPEYILFIASQFVDDSTLSPRGIAPHMRRPEEILESAQKLRLFARALPVDR